ncbi:hypothetical protein IV38_GL000287 [Lactobacillus selangorensis]|uniref:Dihydrodipicolinate synthase n=1 Tax=Lactobacillus selangorensis TaxID=81857 RepID=A0A0R2FP00_9LACO|nr:dihydrodipicolinate synthase family protein [Lactobacillus selangorensis]KRN29403.1 hypothetical protein IV38_GL000287 [Lactobacillus selangorensis]KRN34068.1 hypothetical protein IV40_GL000382 [Lactobacillus selangorensis]
MEREMSVLKTVLTTPMTADGQLNLQAIPAFVTELAATGSSTIVVGAGAEQFLSSAERLLVTEKVNSCLPQGTSLWVAVPQTDLQTALAFAQQYAHINHVSALFVSVPAAPGIHADGAAAYLRVFADHSELPIVILNQSRTVPHLSVQQLLSLALLPQVQGIVTDDVQQLDALIAGTKETPCAVATSVPQHFAQALISGADGIVTPAGQLYGSALQRIARLVHDHEWPDALAAQRALTTLFDECQRVGWHAATKVLQPESGPCRLPLRKPAFSEQQLLQTLNQQVKL